MKWSYKALVAESAADLEREANALGEDGWELVDMIFKRTGTDAGRMVAICKRPKEASKTLPRVRSA